MIDAHVTRRGWADKVAAVCVGGPFDGQRRVEQGPTFHYVEYPGVASYEVNPKAACEPVKVTRGQYIAHMICGCVVWIEKDLPIEKAMQHLLDSYAVPPHLRTRPADSGGPEQ